MHELWVYGAKKCLESLEDIVWRLHNQTLMPKSWLFLYIYMCMLRTVRIKEVIMYYDILLGTNFVSTIRNMEVSTFGRVLKYYINSPSIRTASSVSYLQVSPIERCPLREVPLYIHDIHTVYIHILLNHIQCSKAVPAVVTYTKLPILCTMRWT